MKATNRYRESSQYVQQKFPQMSEAKMKVGISFGPRVSLWIMGIMVTSKKYVTKTLVLEEFK
jgi:hypothetical protein